MSFNLYFNLEEDGTEGLCISVKPTKYLEHLHPHRAMSELKTYIDELYDKLVRYEDKPVCKNMCASPHVKEIRGVLFQIETCEEYLYYLREHYSTIH